MDSIATLPKSLKLKAKERINRELACDRSVEWAIDYHRKLVLMIQEKTERDDYYSEHKGQLCINLKLGIDLEVENAIRALICEVSRLRKSLNQ